MLKKINFKKVVFIVGALVVLFRPTVSFAWEGDHRDNFDRRDHYYRYHDHPRFGMQIDLVSRDYVPVFVGGARYYYYDGLYYAPTRNGYVLMAPPIGAIVPVIPPDYLPIMVNGMTYYTDNGIYYVYTGRGYQVVPPPVVQRIAEPVVMRETVQVVQEPQNQTKVAEGIGLGGVLGALTGGIIGHQMKGHHELGGALIGGATGAAVGGIVGSQIPNENASTPVTVVRSTPVVVTQEPVVVSAPAPVAPQPVATSDDSFTVNVPNGQGGYASVLIKRSGSGFVGPQGEYYAEFPKVSQLQAMYAK